MRITLIMQRDLWTKVQFNLGPYPQAPNLNDTIMGNDIMTYNEEEFVNLCIDPWNIFQLLWIPSSYLFYFFITASFACVCYLTGQLFISKNTNGEQRNAIISIFSGQAKGEGPFALFAGTFKFLLEPQFVDIQTKIDGKKK